MSAAEIFLTERDAETLILTPTVNLSELQYSESMSQSVFDRLDDPTIKNVLLDFRKTDYFGSTALGFFIRLRKMIQDRNGCMAFCNLSAHEKEILEVTKLDAFWSIHTTKEIALAAIKAV